MNSTINSRRSVRKFLEKPVGREKLLQLVEAGMHAPSACNSRPWEFVIVTNRDILKKFKEIVPGGRPLETATAAIVIVAIPQTGRPEGYFPQDCGAAAQNILLEATSNGLGACWCGVYPHPERYQAIAKLLDISEPKIPFNVIAVGYPDETPVQRGFFDPDKVHFVE